MPRKADDGAIADFLNQLAAEPWLDSARRVWPSYLYHFTDVCNVPSIIAADKLLSRSRAEAAGLMATDNASQTIIAQTRQSVRNHVRLYFRPRTPTFYLNEGIRPIGQRDLNAHCPVPVAFLFDSRHVLGMSDTRFSNGNLASYQAVIGDDVSFLREIPFRTVYHDTWFASDEREEIIFRRQAEVIVPNELSLDGLLHVCVRSVAEYETLITALIRDNRVSAAAYNRVLSLVRINSRASLFHYRWTYVERVDIIDDTIRITFNPSTRTPGPFTGTFIFEEAASRVIATDTITDLTANNALWYPIPVQFRRTPFWFTLRLDDCLAYTCKLDPAPEDELLDVPF